MTSELSLDSLAKTINDRHRRAIGLLNNALGYAKECGDALVEVKSQVPHGTFETWLSENCPEVSQRTVRVYKQISQNWGFLEERRERCGPLSISEALTACSEKTAELCRFEREQRASLQAHDALVVCSNDSEAICGYGIPFPEPGRFIRARVTESDYVVVHPHEDTKTFFLTRVEGENQLHLFERAVRKQAVPALLHVLVPEGDQRQLKWKNLPGKSWTGDYHPDCRIHDWWRPIPIDQAMLRSHREIGTHEVWNLLYERLNLDDHFEYSFFDYDQLQREVEAIAGNLYRSAFSSDRNRGCCPKCGGQDGRLLNRTVCWRHQLTWTERHNPERPVAGEETDVYQYFAELMLLKAFFRKVDIEMDEIA